MPVYAIASEQPEPIKNCRWCRSEIPKGASVCSLCRHHQTAFGFFTSTGILAIVGAAVALAGAGFTFQQLSETQDQTEIAEKASAEATNASDLARGAQGAAEAAAGRAEEAFDAGTAATAEAVSATTEAVAAQEGVRKALSGLLLNTIRINVRDAQQNLDTFAQICTPATRAPAAVDDDFVITPPLAPKRSFEKAFEPTIACNFLGDAVDVAIDRAFDVYLQNEPDLLETDRVIALDELCGFSLSLGLATAAIASITGPVFEIRALCAGWSPNPFTFDPLGAK